MASASRKRNHALGRKATAIALSLFVALMGVPFEAFSAHAAPGAEATGGLAGDLANNSAIDSAGASSPDSVAPEEEAPQGSGELSGSEGSDEPGDTANDSPAADGAGGTVRNGEAGNGKSGAEADGGKEAGADALASTFSLPALGGSAPVAPANNTAREARDVTADTDQLQLGIGSFKWEDADGVYKSIDLVDGTYKLPAPFEAIKGLHLILDFKVLKEDETRSLKGGDYFTFSLAQATGDGLEKYFSMADITSPQDISFGGTKIATYVLHDNVLKVTFDADVAFDKGFSKIKGGVSLDFTLTDAAAGAGGETGIDLVLQDRSHPLHVKVPPKSSVVDGVEKTGAYDPATRTIAWTIKAGTKTPGLDMGGMKIVDTFDASKLEFSGAKSVAADGTEADLAGVVQDSAGTCAYTFSAGAIAPQTVKVLTKVKDGALPTGDAANLSNDVALEKGTSPYDPGTNAAASGTATVPGMGIGKQGEQVSGDTMRWSIVVNEREDAWLYNAVVTDVLAANLAYVDGSLKVDGAEVQVLTSEPNPAPTGDYATLVENADGTHTLKFHFVDTEAADYPGKALISKKHTLTFETKLTGQGVNDTAITNTATLDGNWPEGDGPGLGFHNGMGIGTEYRYAYVDKAGEVEKSTGILTWEVHPQIRMDDYTTATLTDTVDATDQQFVPDSVTLEYQGTTYPQARLIAEGWLAVAGAGTQESPTTLAFTLPQSAFAQLNDVHITYQTVAAASSLGAAYVYRNTVDMTVATSAGTFSNTADAEVPLDNNLIGKTAEYEYDDATGKGWLHYTLTANAGGMSLRDVAVTDDFSQLAAVYYQADGTKVADIPPGAWVIDQGKTAITGGSHEAPTYVDGLFSVKLGTGPDYAINTKYTIDLYLALADAARQTYLLDSGSGYIRTMNAARVTGECAGGSIDREAVYETTPEGGDIINELVDKSSLLNENGGYIRWRVDANPNGAQLNSAVVADVLNKSLQLDFASVKLYESEHAAGRIAGQDSQGANWDPATSGWTEVTAYFTVEPGADGSSVLNVKLPDSAKAYTLMFDTFIIEAIDGGTVQNRASLLNDGVEKGDGSHTQDVGEGAWGYLERTASYRFQKVDALGGASQPLGAGVAFGLFADQACGQMIKKVVANESGVFGFYGLKPGTTYWYKELKAPEGYVLDTVAHELVVPSGTFGMQPGLTQVTNERVEPVSANVSIEKQFEFDAATDTAFTQDKRARFKLTMRPLGAGTGKTVGVELSAGASGEYTYQGPAASADVATEMTTTAATGSAPAKASLKITDLPWGDYELTETGAPNGYAQLSGAKKFSVAQSGTVTFGEGFANGAGVLENVKTHITAHKQLNGTEAAVAGAEFKIFDSTGTNVVKSLFTGADYAWQPDGNAWDISGLPAGSYVLRETSPATDTTIAQLADVPFTVAADGSIKLDAQVDNVTLSGSELTLNNVPCASVTVDKLDQFGQAVKGAKLQLQRWDATGAGSWEIVGTERVTDGSALTFNGLLRSTKYRIVETPAPPQGYTQANHDAANKQAIEFSVDEYGQLIDVDLGNNGAPESFDGGNYQNVQSGTAFTLRNERIVGHIEFKKASTEGDAALPGVEFDLFRVAQGTETADVKINASGHFASGADGMVATKGSTLTNADTGLAIGRGLLPGTYYFQECGAPTDFVYDAANPAKTAQVTVAADGSNRYTWPDKKVLNANGDASLGNTPLDASVRVLKATTDGAALNGAEFELSGTDENGTAVSIRATTAARGTTVTARDSSGAERQYATDHDGEALFGNVPAGTYTVREVVPPAGYQLSDRELSVTVTRADSGMAYELNATDPVINDQNDFTVTKQDATGTTALAGAEFKLEGTFADGSSEPLTWTSAEAPHHIMGKLVASTVANEHVYTLTETKAPEHYVITAQPLQLKMDQEGALYTRAVGATLWSPVPGNAVVVKDDPVRGQAVLTKTVADGKAGTVEGVEFSLYKKDAAQGGGDKLIAERCTIGADGAWRTLDQTGVTNPDTGEALSAGLGAGSYYFMETKATPDTALDATHREFAIADNNHYATTSTPVAVSVQNAAFAATLSLAKLDGTSGEALEGAAFQLTYVPEGGGAPQTINLEPASGQPGVFGASDLKKGSYTVRETAVPNGYEEPFEGTFTLRDADNGKTVLVREGAAAGAVVVAKTAGIWSGSGVANTRILGSMTLTKQDDAGGALAGAEFTLELQNGTAWSPVGTYTTDDTGTLTAGDLAWGTYRVTETKAADGFQPGATPPSFTFVIGPNTGTSQHLVWDHGVVPNVKTSVAIDKVDNASPAARLAGAKLKLAGRFADGTTEKAWTSAADAAETFEGQLVVGESYALTETERLAHHLALPGPITFALTVAGTISLMDNPTFADGSKAAVLSADALTLSVRNVRVVGAVTLLKTDAETHAPLEGAQFSLFAQDGTLVREGLVTGTSYDADGWTATPGEAGRLTVAGLDLGSYYFQEVAATGYQVSDDRLPFTIDAGNGVKDLSVDLGQVENIRTELTFGKVERYAESCSDASLGATAADAVRALAGAEFAAFVDAHCSTVAKTADGADAVAVSGSDGAVTFKRLPGGATYYVKETAVPAGRVSDGAVYAAVFAADGTLERFERTDAPGAKVTQVVNDVVRTDIRIKKVAETDEGKVLPGSTYGLFKRVAPETRLLSCAAALPVPGAPVGEGLQLIAKATTGPDGYLVFEGVLMDTEYVIQELVAPEGSLVSKNPITMTFDMETDGAPHLVAFDDGSGTAKVGEDGTIVWREPQVMVGFAKTNPAGALLAGAKLQVVDEAGAVAVEPWMSSAAEEHVVEGVLVAGATYRLVELEAPAGYMKAADVEFTVDDPKLAPDQNYVQHVTMVNQPVPAKPEKPKPSRPAPVRPGGLLQTGDPLAQAALLMGGIAVIAAATAGASALKRRRKQ